MKNPKLKKILVVLSCIPILFVGLSVPIGAVVNSTTGAAGTNQLYAQSVFPFTVGFVYDDINDDGRYIMSTPLGHWGVENNKTLDGVDEFDFSNILTSNIGGGTDTGTISYTFGDVVWPDFQHYVNDSSGYKYRGGYYDMSLTASVPEFMDNVTSLVFRARDIYYNPVWNNKFFTSDAGFGPKNFLIPTFTLPTLSDPTTQAFVGAYSVDATIIDGRGVSHDVAYSVPIDTREDGNVPIMFINREALAPYVSYSETGNDIKSSANDTIIISDFTGYLDVQYYEYTVSDSLAGTWVFNDEVSITQFRSGSDILVNGTFYGAVNDSLELGYLDISHLHLYNSVSYVAINSNYGYPQSVNLIYSDASVVSFVNSSSDNERSTFYDGEDFLLSRTIHITDTFAELVSTNGQDLADNFLYELEANATKQGSTSTVAEGTWEPVENTSLASQINVTVPMYDTSRAMSEKGSTEWRLWSLPVASKYIKTTDLYQIINESIVKDYTSWLAQATGGFLDAEIFPGFTIGGVMGTLIAFSVVMLFLKLFAGG